MQVSIGIIKMGTAFKVSIYYTFYIEMSIGKKKKTLVDMDVWWRLEALEHVM